MTGINREERARTLVELTDAICGYIVAHQEAIEKAMVMGRHEIDLFQVFGHGAVVRCCSRFWEGDCFAGAVAPYLRRNLDKKFGYLFFRDVRAVLEERFPSMLFTWFTFDDDIIGVRYRGLKNDECDSDDSMM